MFDGLVIWLAMVGVATTAMLTFDVLCWTWRTSTIVFRHFVPKEHIDAADEATSGDMSMSEGHSR